MPTTIISPNNVAGLARVGQRSGEAVSARSERFVELDQLIALGKGDERPVLRSSRPVLGYFRHQAYAAKMRAGKPPNTRRVDILSGWPRARQIIASVATKHGLEPKQLQKNGEHGGSFRLMVQARAEAMTAIRHELGYSFPLIGRIFGGFHHSSVMHLVQKFEGDPRIEPPAVEVQLERLERQAAELAQGLAELKAMVRK